MRFIMQIGEDFDFEIDNKKYYGVVKMLCRYNNENYLYARVVPFEDRETTDRSKFLGIVMREDIVDEDLRLTYISDQALYTAVTDKMVRQCKALKRDGRKDFDPYNEPDYE